MATNLISSVHVRNEKMASSPERKPDEPVPGAEPERKVLFLDDDPERAKTFLEKKPTAIWVETVDDCLKRLEEKWDEVHLDHDLGGERYVQVDREDCGMEVVRWLCLSPHPHLMETRFFIHSHNESAASIMMSQMHIAGFRVAFRPFGSTEASPPRFSRGVQNLQPARPAGGFRRWLINILRLINGEPTRTLADDESTRR